MNNRENISDLPAQANSAPAAGPLLSVSDWEEDLKKSEKAFKEWEEGFNWDMGLNWDIPFDWTTP